MYGLVLEGGGAKGAYHIGAYFALKELGYNFEAVVGTSIGAINGAMIAMGRADKCASLWRSMSMDDFIYEDRYKKETDILIKDALDGKFSFDKFKKLIEKLTRNGMSVEPLKNLVKENIDEDLVRNSKIKFGLTTLNLSDMKAEELFIGEIEEGFLNDYIIASCYLPVFRLEQLHGKYYLDGGFFNATPYNMVENLGLTPIIIKVNPIGVIDNNFPEDALVIAPSKKYTSSLDFDPIKSDEIMRIAYFDTYKKIKGLLGDKYYINPFDEDKALDILEYIFFENIEYFSKDIRHKKTSKYRRFFEQIIPDIASNFGLRGDYTYVELVLAILEYHADKYNIDYLKIYNIDDFLKSIFNLISIEDIELDKNLIAEYLKKIIK